MAEYIDRETVLHAILGEPTESHYPDWYADKIKALPSVDAVPVVRCKDCEWFMREHGCPIEASGYHRGGRSLPVENDFCSYGERKDGGADNEP